MEPKVYKNIFLPDPSFVLEETLIDEINTYNDSFPDEIEKRNAILKSITGETFQDFYIELPFFCIERNNMKFGSCVYFNFCARIYNASTIHIGSRTKFGPRARVFSGLNEDFTKNENKITRLGDDCWIGGNVTIKSGVTIGDRVVIGAGSIVYDDIPSDSLAVGNPAHVIRKI